MTLKNLSPVVGISKQGTNTEEFKITAEVTHRLLDNDIQFDSAINHILKLFGETFQIDRSYLFKNTNPSLNSANIAYTNEWCAEGIEAFLGSPELENVPWDIMPDVFHEMQQGKVMFGHVLDHPSEVFRNLMELQSIQSYLFFPIKIENYFFGFVGFDSCKRKRQWTEIEAHFLSTLGGLIAHRFLREKLSFELETKVQQETQWNACLLEFQKLHDQVQQSDALEEIYEEVIPIAQSFFGALHIFLIEQEGLVGADPLFSSQCLQQHDGLMQELMTCLSGSAFSISDRGISLAQPGHSSRYEPERTMDSSLHYIKNLWIDHLNSHHQKSHLLIVINFDARLKHVKEPHFKNFSIALESLLANLETKISQLKVQSSLRQSEAKFRMLSENASDIIIQHDNQARFLYISPSVEQVLGFTPSELLGKQPFDFSFGLNNKEKILSLLALSKAGKELPMVTLWYQKKDSGKRLALQSSFRTLKNKKGEVSGFISISREVTDEIKVKEELARSERKFRLISENMSDVIAIHDSQLNFKWVSPSFFTLMEVSEQEILGKHPDDIWPIRNHRIVDEDPTSGRRTIEVEHKLKSGKWITLELKLSPYLDQEIGFEGILAIGRDVTERKIFENKLMEQRNSFENILEGTLGGYWTYFPKKNENFYSVKFKQLLGYKDHELSNSPETWRSLMHPDDIDPMWEMVQAHLASDGEIPVFKEVRYRHKDGKILHILCAGTIVQRDTDGSALELVGTHIDITSLREIEQELFRVEAALDLILENSGLVIWIRDIASNELLFVSKSAKEIFEIDERGMKQGEKFYFRNVHPDDQAIIDKMYRSNEYVAHGKVDAKYRIRTKTGTYIWLRTRGYTVYDADKKALRVGISEDISREKQWEQELKTNLERERELNAMKSYFISMVSHQFRTPMAIMQTNAELISMVSTKVEKDTQQKIEKYTHRITGEIQRLTSLLSDILVLEKSRIGKLKIKFEKLDLVHLVREIVEDLNAQSGKEGSMVLPSGQYSFPILSDENFLRHAMTNLIGNAYKYTPNDKPAPIITLAADNSHYQIVIQDFGIGIHEEEISSLFDSFFRGSNSTAFQGTGLGLVIAKEFIKALGGEITVRSKIQEGSTFTLLLPRTNKEKHG